MTTTKKLPVWTTIAGSYAFPFRNWREMIRIGWLPLVAILILDGAIIYSHHIYGYLIDFPAKFQMFQIFMTVAVVFASRWLITAMVAVAWHRLVLFDSRIKGRIVAFGLGRREWRYIGLSLVIGVIMLGLLWVVYYIASSRLVTFFFLDFLPTIITGSVQAFLWTMFVLVGLPAFLALTYVLAILWLALPATAVDRGRGLEGAWKLGRGNGKALVLVALGILAPSICIYIAGQLFQPEAALEGVALYGLLAVGSTVNIVLTFIVATGLSLSYRGLGGLDDAGVTEGGE